MKEDSTIYCYNVNGGIAFAETFSTNNRIKKSVYNYSGDTIRKDNYLLGNDSNYFLISYEVTKIDSIAKTTFVKYVNIEDVYASQTTLFSFYQNDQLKSIKTLSNIDHKIIIDERNYTYKDEGIHEEIFVDRDGTISIIFDYSDFDNNGNWTKKMARENGEQLEVAYEIRTIEYW